MSRAWPILASLALAACGSRDDAGAPGPASAGEERALGDAAEMIARGRPSETAPPASGSFPEASAPSAGASQPAR